MPTIFPLNPTVNQTHTTGGITWRWTGTLWELFTDLAQVFDHVHGYDGAVVSAVSYTHLTLPTNREV